VPFLGAHLSVAGGLWRAPEAAIATGSEALQIFLRAPGRWAARALEVDTVARFRRGLRDAGVTATCFAHAPYLLNLASNDEGLRRQSVEVLVDELVRAATLGLRGVVLHPGSAGDGDRYDAESRCRASVAEVLDRAGGRGARLILEGQAGAGGQLGRTPGELARLVDGNIRRRVGLCLDTAHLWGAGYDLRGDGWPVVLAELGDSWGLVAPDLLHANDTPVALGSHRDHHAAPGEGVLGEAFYRRLLTDAALAATPIILEIPPGKNNRLITAALARLHTWAKPSGDSDASA
jgi:deoxyribonuclease-4